MAERIALNNLNEIFVVWERSDQYDFHHIYIYEEHAKEHVRKRLEMIKGTEMDGRDVHYKKYVVLE
jgi:hypothetical protein